MYSKSSTALALISVLSILIVMFIAISNVEDSPIRKPFPSVGAEGNMIVRENIETVGAFDRETSGESIVHKSTISDLVQKIQNTSETKPNTIEAELLNRNINNEVLDKVGYKSYVIKPQPFNGKLFDIFDMSMLSYLDIVDKKVIQVIDGNEILVLRAYEFNFTDSASTQEIYDFLRAKIKDELGVTINESNQFGLSSFYVNFQEVKERAFLVVKTRSNVYALSYPKDKAGGNLYFQLTSKLLSELI